MPRYFRGVPITDDAEPVQYVGVHPVVWHDHPEQPQLGFTPVTDEVKETQAQRNDFLSALIKIKRAAQDAMDFDDLAVSQEETRKVILLVNNAIDGVPDEDPLTTEKKKNAENN